MTRHKVWAPMCWRALILGAIVLTVGWPLVESALAGKFNAVLSVGDAAPSFRELSGVDDAAHSLDEYRDAKIVVVVFTSCQSPCATAYERRLAALHKDYHQRGVQWIAISVGRQAADSLPKMKQRSASAGWDFPFLQDASQQTGRDFGATTTPQVFVLDAQRRVQYMGRIDDQTEEVDVQRPFLRQALDALLEGRAPPTTETRPEGCRIKYE